MKYYPTMFEPYRRDLVAKSLFKMSEILWGILFASILFSGLPNRIKLAVSVIIVLVFIAGWLWSPPKPPERDHADQP